MVENYNYYLFAETLNIYKYNHIYIYNYVYFIFGVISEYKFYKLSLYFIHIVHTYILLYIINRIWIYKVLKKKVIKIKIK